MLYGLLDELRDQAATPAEGWWSLAAPAGQVAADSSIRMYADQVEARGGENGLCFGRLTRTRDPATTSAGSASSTPARPRPPLMDGGHRRPAPSTSPPPRTPRAYAVGGTCVPGTGRSPASTTRSSTSRPPHPRRTRS
jgi:hypothetical protein